MRLNKITPTPFLLTLLLGVSFLQSCTKNQHTVDTVTPDSRLSKVVFDSGYISTGFTTLNYAADKLINIHFFDSIHHSSADYDITYPAQNQVNVIDRGNTSQFNLYSYNSKNQLIKIEFPRYASGQWAKYAYTFHWTGNQVAYVTSNEPGIDPNRARGTYKYDAKGNIIEFVRNQKYNYEAASYRFSYDDRSNFYETNQLYFLFDISMQSGSVDVSIPILFSKNNMVLMEVMTENPIHIYSTSKINYKTDDKGRMIQTFGDSLYYGATKYYY